MISQAFGWVEIIAVGVPVVASMLALSLAVVWLASRILAAFDRHMRDHHDTPTRTLDTDTDPPDNSGPLASRKDDHD